MHRVTRKKELVRCEDFNHGEIRPSLHTYDSYLGHEDENEVSGKQVSLDTGDCIWRSGGDESQAGYASRAWHRANMRLWKTRLRGSACGRGASASGSSFERPAPGFFLGSIPPQLSAAARVSWRTARTWGARRQVT